MKNFLGFLIVLPAICMALGYGGGMYLSKPDHTVTTDIEHGENTHGGHAVVTDSHGNVVETAESKPIVVKLGQMIVPVYKARSVTYVVTNLGVIVQDIKDAEHYNIGENAVRLRDAIFTSLKLSAEGPDLKGVSIDTEKLASHIAEDIKPKFGKVDNVIFLDFYKKDVARS